MKTQNKAVLWVGVLGVLVGSVFLLSRFVGVQDASENTTNGQSAVEVSARDIDHKKGSGPLVLIEYSDFQCPACGSYYPILKKVSQEFDGKVTFIYRHFPLFQIHANANYAAYASEAAAVQGKFWEMHDMLFEKQKEWSSRADAKGIFTEYAGAIGLDKEQFQKDFEDNSLRERVKASYDEAEKLNLSGTPSFFLDGKRIDNPNSYEELRDLLQSSIK